MKGRNLRPGRRFLRDGGEVPLEERGHHGIFEIAPREQGHRRQPAGEEEGQQSKEKENAHEQGKDLGQEGLAEFGEEGGEQQAPEGGEQQEHHHEHEVNQFGELDHDRLEEMELKGLVPPLVREEQAEHADEAEQGKEDAEVGEGGQGALFVVHAGIIHQEVGSRKLETGRWNSEFGS